MVRFVSKSFRYNWNYIINICIVLIWYIFNYSIYLLHIETICRFHNLLQFFCVYVKIKCKNLISILQCNSFFLFLSDIQLTHTHTHVRLTQLTAVYAKCFGLSHTRLRGKHTHTHMHTRNFPSYIASLLCKLIKLETTTSTSTTTTTRQQGAIKTNRQTDRQTGIDNKEKGKWRQQGRGRGVENSLLLSADRAQTLCEQFVFFFQGSRTWMSAKVSFVI